LDLEVPDVSDWVEILVGIVWHDATCSCCFSQRRIADSSKVHRDPGLRCTALGRSPAAAIIWTVLRLYPRIAATRGIWMRSEVKGLTPAGTSRVTRDRAVQIEPGRCRSRRRD